MKMMRVLIPALLAGVSVSAIGETRKPAEIKKPVTHWTCREFIALGHEYQPKAVY